MIKITSSEQFESIIANMEQHYKNVEAILQREDKNMERINETETWAGDTQGVIYSKYQELHENYDPILTSLQTFIKFMRQTVTDYKELETKIGNDADMNSEELDVNS